jgi:hypothetical protein
MYNKRIEIDTTKVFLKIAEKQLELMNNVHDDPIRTLFICSEHAIIIIIMSACAVESFVNAIIFLPILLLKKKNERQYYSNILKRYLRSNIYEKIELLSTYFQFNKNIKEDIRILFKYRNEIMHASPEFQETNEKLVQSYLPNNKLDKFSKYPSIAFFSIRDSKLIGKAEQSYKIAIKFINSCNVSEYINQMKQ